MSLMRAPLKGNPIFWEPLQKLNPIYVSGVLRDGGCLRRAPLEFKTDTPDLESQ